MVRVWVVAITLLFFVVVLKKQSHHGPVVWPTRIQKHARVRALRRNLYLHTRRKRSMTRGQSAIYTLHCFSYEGQTNINGTAEWRNEFKRANIIQYKDKHCTYADTKLWAIATIARKKCYDDVDRQRSITTMVHGDTVTTQTFHCNPSRPNSPTAQKSIGIHSFSISRPCCSFASSALSILTYNTICHSWWTSFATITPQLLHKHNLPHTQSSPW